MYNSNPNQAAVILIHGLMRSEKSMARLGQYLSNNGYKVYVYSYPSTQYGIKEHGQHLRLYIDKLMSNNN